MSWNAVDLYDEIIRLIERFFLKGRRSFKKKPSFQTDPLSFFKFSLPDYPTGLALFTAYLGGSVLTDGRAGGVPLATTRSGVETTEGRERIQRDSSRASGTPPRSSPRVCRLTTNRQIGDTCVSIWLNNTLALWQGEKQFAIPIDNVHHIYC